MSLPASQRRALNRIEETLADDHPGLGPLFAIFTRLVGQEAMPVTERVTAWRWRSRRMWRMWPTVAAVVGLAMVTGACTGTGHLPAEAGSRKIGGKD
jgi:anti-sigma-K factor RskA